MGLFDYIYGRTDKQRTRRVEKVREKFGSHEGLTGPMLTALAAANDMPDEKHIKLYQLSVPAGAVPDRVSLGYVLENSRYDMAVLFPDGISMFAAEYETVKKGEEPPTGGAQIPFWGITDAEVVLMDSGVSALIISGSDGKRPYRLGYINYDNKEIKSLLEDLNSARRADAQKRAERPKVNIDTSLPPEEQLAAAKQMRDIGAIPEDVYQATVRTVREAHTERS